MHNRQSSKSNRKKNKQRYLSYEGILHKQIQINTPYWITKLTIIFLSNRKITLKNNQAVSKSFTAEAGIPQGSIVSSVLFITNVTNRNSVIYQFTKCRWHCYMLHTWKTTNKNRTSTIWKQLPRKIVPKMETNPQRRKKAYTLSSRVSRTWSQV